MTKNVNIVGLKELRENTKKVISAVRRGKSFTVVRRSKPIFRITPVDEWGDEGVWETVADLTDVKKEGISADEFLSHLKAYGAKN